MIEMLLLFSSRVINSWNLECCRPKTRLIMAAARGGEGGAAVLANTLAARVPSDGAH